ncbi:hypothetical protein CcCBS67573_g02202 [Chytriomyces confervae]|uniref:SCD domain-containing protein n=1 Tax=Chytriomyces confervae TaxID=246404 RepID=A0A507FJU2_9FUNG|nr:hypothetical protein CcCBS67573_g02202 [Chytriomyces confervae]
MLGAEEQQQNDESLKRRRSTRNTPAKKIQTEWPETDSPSSSSEADSDLEVTPKAAKVQQTRRRPAKQKQAPSQSTDTGSLFAIISSPSASIQTAVAEWMDEYSENEESATVEIINFIIQSSGNAGSIDASALEDEDLITTMLEDLQSMIESTESYPLIAKRSVSTGNRAKTVTSAKFRSNLAEFWTKWFTSLKNKPENSPIYVHATAATPCVFQTVKTWLSTMSSSPFRSFRHTATTIVLILMTCLCDTSATVMQEWTTLSRQLETVRKQASSKTRSDRVVQLTSDVDSLNDKKQVLEKHMADLFDGVFVHRYRDTDAVIRTECIKELGVWIKKFPDLYLDASYLRYMGWMVSNNANSVRLESLKSLLTLYNTPEMISPLRAFTERFSHRFIEMSLREVDPSVRTLAIQLVTRCCDAGLISSQDRMLFFTVLFSNDEHARDAVAGYFAEVLKGEVITEAVEVAEEVVGRSDRDGDSNADGKLDAMEDGWVSWKAAVGYFLDLGNVLMTRRVGATPALENAPEKKKVAKKTDRTPFSLRMTQSQDSVVDDSMDVDEDADEASQMNLDDIDEETCDRIVSKLKLSTEIRVWSMTGGRTFGNEAADSDSETSLQSALTVLGSENTTVAVSTLWQHLEDFLNWEDGLKYLSSDLSLASEASDTATHEELAVAQVHKLSPEQELMLALVLNAALDAILETTNEADKRGKQKSAKAGDDAKAEVSKALIQYLPKLLKKYGNEYTGLGHQVLTEVIKMVRKLDVIAYVDLRLMKAYESLLEDLSQIFLRQSGDAILHEFSLTFAHLCGISNDSEMTQLSPKQRGKSKRALAMESSTSASAAASSSGLSDAALEKWADLVEQHVAAQLVSNIDNISALKRENDETHSEGSDWNGFDLVCESVGALKRAHALGYVVDISKASFRLESDDSQNSPSHFASIEEILLALEPLIFHIWGMAVTRSSLNKDEETVEREIRTHLECSKAMGEIAELQALDLLYHLSAHSDESSVTSVGESVARKLEGLQKNLTAAFSSIRGTSWYFSAGFKMTAGQAYMDVLHAFHLVTVGKNQDFNESIRQLMASSVSTDFLDAIVDHAVSVLEAVGIPNDKMEQTIARTHPSLKVFAPFLQESAPEAAELCQELCTLKLLKLCGGLAGLISAGVLSANGPKCHAALLCRFTGISFDTVSQMALPLFGEAFDSVSELLLARLIVGKVELYFDAFENRSDGEGEVEMEALRTVLEEAAAVMKESLIKSFDLYLTGKLSSLNHLEVLSKCIISKIKEWPQILSGDNDDAVYMQASGIRALLMMLRDLVDRMVECSASAARRSDDDDVSDSRSIDDGSSTRSLSEINAAWAIWGALGGMVSHIEQEMSVAYKPEEGDSNIASIQDLLEYTSNSLAKSKIKPNDTDGMWTPYWAFVRHLEQGDSKIVKRGRKKKAPTATAARVKSSPKESSKRRTKKAAPKKLEFKSSTQVEDSDEEEQETTPKGLKGGQVSGFKKATNAYDNLGDASDDEEEEDEEPLVVQKKSVRRSPRKTSQQAKKRGAFTDEEDENEEELDEQLRSESTQASGDVPVKSVLGKRPAVSSTRSRSRSLSAALDSSENGDGASGNESEEEDDEDETKEDDAESVVSKRPVAKRVRL